MDTVKRAKLYIKNMKATDSTSEHHKLIVALLLEVKCLKVQVQDRGNSYKKLAAENARLTSLCANYREALEKAHSALMEVDDCQGSACCIPERSVYMICQEAATAVKAALQKEGKQND